jgi:gamma-glutamyl hercynylcysteine S-oxide synthase
MRKPIVLGPNAAYQQKPSGDCAAKTRTDFQWGQVWEWTQDAFEPYEGFVAHPYTEYSEPWFGTHKVLRGASQFTHSVLRDVNYRNFFTA